MRNWWKYAFLIMFGILSGRADAQSVPDLQEIKAFGTNPGNLKCYLHAPKALPQTEKPLVVVLHGCGQNAQGVASLTGWNKLADLHGFYVLYPEQKLTNNPNLCFNWFNGNDIVKGQGENASIAEMIAFVGKGFPIDSSKIYITGLSAGAAMSVVMAATHPARFQQAAIFAGCAYRLASSPQDAVRVLMGSGVHGSAKLVEAVRKENTGYSGPFPRLIIYQGMNDAIVDRRRAQELVAQWTGVCGGDTVPETVEPHFDGIQDISRFVYADSSGSACVTYYKVDHLGHRLLIHPGKGDAEGGKLGIFGADKGFHSTYQTARDFGIVVGK